MFDTNKITEKLQKLGVGRRSLDDELLGADGVPPRLGIYDEDEEDQCHRAIRSACPVPGCVYTAASLLELENHYGARHRYGCAACRRALPSPHLLDLHIQETHDSFFAAMAARKPSYCCYIQECTDKFINSEERLEHCVKVHKLPKDFRFESRSQNKTKLQATAHSMDVDSIATTDSREPQHVFFHNNKGRGLHKYSGKTFTSNKRDEPSSTTNIDEIMFDLKDNLPE